MTAGISMHQRASVLDALGADPPSELDATVAALRSSYRQLLSRESLSVEESDQYVLGRLGALLDIASVAKERRSPSELWDLVLTKQYEPIVQSLLEREMRNRDLAEALGLGPDIISRRLRELSLAGAVISRRSGREVYNRLSHAARSALATGARVSAVARVGEEEWSWDVFDSQVGRLSTNILGMGPRPDVLIGVSPGGGVVADRLAANFASLGATIPTLTLNIDRGPSGPSFALLSNEGIRPSLENLKPSRALLVDDKTCSGVVLDAALRFLRGLWQPRPVETLLTAVVVYVRNSLIEPNYYAYEMQTDGSSRGVKLPSSRPSVAA